MAQKTIRRAAKTEVEQISLEIIPSMEPKLGRVYSNYVQISHSPYDFTIRFADAPSGRDVQKLREGNQITIPSLVDIVVVPELIPEIIEALKANYEKYLNNIKRIASKEEIPEG